MSVEERNRQETRDSAARRVTSAIVQCPSVLTDPERGPALQDEETPVRQVPRWQPVTDTPGPAQPTGTGGGAHGQRCLPGVGPTWRKLQVGGLEPRLGPWLLDLCPGLGDLLAYGCCPPQRSTTEHQVMPFPRHLLGQQLPRMILEEIKQTPSDCSCRLTGQELGGHTPMWFCTSEHLGWFLSRSCSWLPWYC